jgi:hypothetical protein
MYDVTKIKTGFAGQVGWRQSPDNDFAQLSSTVTASASGLYFNDFHPLVTFENIDATSPDFDNANLTTYAAGTTYAVSAKVKDGGIAYISLAGTNIGKTPASSPTWWRPLIEDHLLNIQNQALLKVMQGVINSKKLNQASKGIFENLRIFEGAGKLNNTVIKQSRFVGLEITLKKFDGLQCRIDYVGFQFSQAQTSRTLYLFHSSKVDAIATFSFSTTTAQSFEWKAVTNFILKYVNFDQTTVGNQTDAGGSFYLGYFEDDITGQAISKDIDFSRSPCAGCVTETYNVYAYNQYSKYLNIRPIAVEDANLNGTQLWDIEKNTYSRFGNYGLNLSLTVTPDLTDFFIRNKSVLLDAWGKQVAVDVLNLIRTTTRTNRVGELTRQAALFDLKGDSSKPNTGLEYDLQQAIAAVEVDVSGLGSPVLDAYKRSQVKTRAI